jgi:hypothetical protein
MDIDKNCNSKSFVFIDTMIWIDLANKKLSINKFEKWLNDRKLAPVLHPSLLIELFHSEFTEDFDYRWSIVENYCFSNFSPLDIVYEEFCFVYFNGYVNKDDMLKDAVYQLGKKNIMIWKKEYIENSQYFRSYKNHSAKKELFIKGATHFSEEVQSIKLVDVIHKIDDTDSSALEKVSSGISNEIQNYLNKHTRSQFNPIEITEKILVGMKPYQEILRGISLLRNLKFSISEILGQTIGEHSQLLSYIQILKNSFEQTSLSPDQWEDYIEKLRNKPIEIFPGYSLMTKVSNKIRISKAKTKRSDTMDFTNLPFVPYCSCYVSDAHIIDAIKQCSTEIETELVSVRELKEIIE